MKATQKVQTKTTVTKVEVKQTTQHPYQKYVKPGLSLQNILKLKECFDVFDYDKGGSISVDELTSTIKALGLDKDAAKILGLVQAHSGGEPIDFEGFLQIFGFSGDLKSESTLQGIYDEFDKDRKGYFTAEDFAYVAELVGEKFNGNEIQKMIEYADKDKDGVINYQEFIDVVTRQFPKI